MELQTIAEEPAAASRRSSTTEGHEHEPRKVVIASGRCEGNDTATLIAVAARVLRRDDLLSVVHVDSQAGVMASGGRKHATSYKTDGWPAWMPAWLKQWPEPGNVTAYELHAAGSTADSLVDFVATELKPDLLLVGNRPRGMMSRMFTAGVSSAVVEYADVPTLVTRGAAAPPQLGEEAERRVAICLDGSASCRKVVEWAAKAFLSPADDVYLLHSPAGLQASELLPAMGNIEASRAFLLSQGFAEHRVSPVELDFQTDPRDAIVDFLESDTKPFEFCILSSRGLKGTLTRFMLGSVTRYLLLYAPCSLLVLPPAALGEAVESGPA